MVIKNSPPPPWLRRIFDFRGGGRGCSGWRERYLKKTGMVFENLECFSEKRPTYTVLFNRNSPPLKSKILLNQGGAVLDVQFWSWLRFEKIKGGTLVFLYFQNFEVRNWRKCHTIEGGAVPDVQYRNIVILPLIRGGLFPGGLFRLNRTVSKNNWTSFGICYSQSPFGG